MAPVAKVRTTVPGLSRHLDRSHAYVHEQRHEARSKGRVAVSPVMEEARVMAHKLAHESKKLLQIARFKIVFKAGEVV